MSPAVIRIFQETDFLFKHCSNLIQFQLVTLRHFNPRTTSTLGQSDSDYRHLDVTAEVATIFRM